MHYAEQVAKNGGQPPGMPPPYGVDLSQHDPNAPPPHPFPHPNGPGPADPNLNEFRARFHRSIVAPTPFRSAFGDSQTASATTPSSGSGSAPTEAIDPHLATTANANSTNGTSKSKYLFSESNFIYRLRHFFSLQVEGAKLRKLYSILSQRGLISNHNQCIPCGSSINSQSKSFIREQQAVFAP